jgi:diaminohydroxyphosphoribosylaminopyrimidine deaminase/5-amino-6-(5-phosphoribosylamino)uracil reductase
VEGGARVHGSFLAAGRIDRLHLFFGPKVFGAGPSWIEGWAADSVASAKGFEIVSTSLLEGDLWVEARPRAQRSETD